MQNTNKFYLVDASQIQMTKQRDFEYQFRNQPPTLTQQKTLDRKMQDIINDETISEDEKVNRYNNTLASYLTNIQQQSHKPPMPHKETIQNIEKSDDIDPILPISERFKKKAKSLLTYLSNTGALTFNKIGETQINGKSIPGSNISDMLNQAVNSYSKTQAVGWDDFQALLNESNAPKSLLKKDLQQNTISANNQKDLDFFDTPDAAFHTPQAGALDQGNSPNKTPNHNKRRRHYRQQRKYWENHDQ